MSPMYRRVAVHGRHPVLVASYDTHNCCQKRLVNFTIQAYSSSGTNPVYSYTDPGGLAQLVYTVVSPALIQTPVESVRFDVNKNTDSLSIMALCEVYAFGEVVCSAGKFGRQCERDCNCANQTEACFVSTGGCPSGCAAGYTGEDCYTQCPNTKFGEGCTESCNNTCLNRECDHRTGVCDRGCVSGYIGDFCEQECPNTKFGEGCAESCSTTCLNRDCDHRTGVCDSGCVSGYIGDFCEQECPNTKFGEVCAESCSTTCLNRECDHRTGVCDSGCVSGYIGDFCEQACNLGTYGEDCNKICSDHCAGEKKSCDHVNGTCDQGCDSGYMMPLCTQTRQNVGGEHSGEGADDSVGGALVPAVIGVVAAVTVITAAIVGILFWRRHTGAKHESGDGRIIELAVETGSASSNPTFDTDKSERPSAQSKSRSVSFTRAQEVDGEEKEEDERSETSESPYTNILTGDTSVPVEKLKTYLHEHSTDSYFNDQFTAIPMNFGENQTNGRATRNRKKNRYKNIIPYDRNRVLLEADERRELADYINASYVKGYNSCETFIASQGPNDVTLIDFVRMIWEQNIDRVVMLTHLIEEGKKKCTMYWPEDGDQTIGEINMQLLTTKVFAEYTIRHLRLYKDDESPRDVTQFHFTAWPDKSVPENPWGLVDFQQRAMAEPGPGRLLVHCSAGVGRTGTFIALCNLLQEAEVSGKMDFRSTMHTLRQDRMHMIQTVAQYTFLHKAALVGHMTFSSTMQAKNIPARFQSLDGGGSGDMSARSYQQEFDDLAAFCDAETIMSTEQSGVEESVYANERVMDKNSKDRLSNILPNYNHRPILTAEGKDEDTYINAVLVPNLKKNSHDILTQLPLPTTVTDFWRLVTQFDVGLVVAFDVDLRTTDETIGDFLPENDREPLKTERFEISSTTVSEDSAIKEMFLTVQKKGMNGPFTSTGQHNLTCLLCKNSTLDPGTVLEIVNKIIACRPSETCRSVYTCR
ncbi:receptor-type tyrosine-protein phosphatase kappa [Plakobranchus ocellatus]|uniref:protein-tyrosine-phosphatase n=1 Tax=Plakobranchus ocellatus TaxID=259542 RepID=A0AAV4D5R8_9GAST|nr:receptor-type tyrosine-protein phosphatase kappa [Plakobranchus ocellatus]